MKISKSELKSIVKECLVEILQEGLGSSNFGSTNLKTFPVGRSSFSENARNFPQDNRKASPQLKDAIRREAGGNKIMESIFADTAASTLPKMLNSDSRSAPVQAPGGLVEQVVASTSPEDLFGDEIASKWADLAFMQSSLKK